MGRRKIEIKMVEDKKVRQVTFTNRRQGLFTKANELATLCGAEVAIVAFSPGGIPFSFGSPSVDSVVDRFLDGNSNEESTGCCCSNGSSSREPCKICKLSDEYEDLKKQLEIEEKKGKMLDEALNQNNLKKGKLPIDDLDLSQLEKLKGSLEKLRDAAKLRVKEIGACEALMLLADKPVIARKNRN